MACFLVCTAQAVATAAAAKFMEKKEKQQEAVKIALPDGEVTLAHKLPFSHKLKWLTKLQLGGALLLAFEHVWHGEVTPWFPFLTAAADPADTAEMLHEMATVGVGMALLTTLVWVGMLVVSSRMEKTAQKEAALAAAK